MLCSCGVCDAASAEYCNGLALAAVRATAARIKDERNSDRGENCTRSMGVSDPFCLFSVVVQAIYARAISI